jgi:hypothetical protein
MPAVKTMAGPSQSATHNAAQARYHLHFCESHMKFVNEAPLFKISRITGPKHNFLGLQFAESPLAGGPTVERLAVSFAESVEERLSDGEVLDQIRSGLDEARNFCTGTYWLEKIQYVPTDSRPVEVYKDLTIEIVRRIESMVLTGSRKVDRAT